MLVNPCLLFRLLCWVISVARAADEMAPRGWMGTDAHHVVPTSPMVVDMDQPFMAGVTRARDEALPAAEQLERVWCLSLLEWRTMHRRTAHCAKLLVGAVRQGDCSSN